MGHSLWLASFSAQFCSLQITSAPVRLMEHKLNNASAPSAFSICVGSAHQQKQQQQHHPEHQPNADTAQQTPSSDVKDASDFCNTAPATAPASLDLASKACHDQRMQGHQSELGAASVAVAVAAELECLHLRAAQVRADFGFEHFQEWVNVNMTLCSDRVPAIKRTVGGEERI